MRPRGYPEDPRPLKREVEDHPEALGWSGEPLPLVRTEPRRVTDLGGTVSFSPNVSGVDDTGWVPPDGAVAVGPDQVIQVVNTTFRIMDRTGLSLFEAPIEDWFQLPVDIQAGDPRVEYDPIAGRWIMLASTFDLDPTGGYVLVTISDTPDAMGQWTNFRLPFTPASMTPSAFWLDYPTVGFDDQAIYISGNVYRRAGGSGTGFTGALLRCYPKAQFSSTAAQIEGWEWFGLDRKKAATIQPAVTFGTPGVEWLACISGLKGSQLTVFALTNPLRPQGPLLTVPTRMSVRAFTVPPNAQQEGSAGLLDTGDTRLQNLVYSQGTLWTAHTVAARWAGDPRARSAARWYQIHAPTPKAGALPRVTLAQQGTAGGARLEYFYPAVMPDASGNLSISCATSGPTRFPSAAYLGRLTTDPRGRITRTALFGEGQAAYATERQGTPNRWGDFCGIARDPSDPGVIWVEGEVCPSANTWATQVAAVRN